MPKYTYDKIKERLNKMIDLGNEPEITLFIYGKVYMIIGYEGRCSFQRCGFHDGSGEFYYNTLDELYNSVTVDNILLSRDWNDISNFERDSYEWYCDEDIWGSEET